MSAITYRPVSVQHPSETIPYKFPFSDFLAANDDSIASWFVQADSGVSLSGAALDPDEQTITVDVSGGASSYSYVVAAQITTNDGLVRRLEIVVRVRGQALTGDLLTDAGNVGDVDGGNAAGTGVSGLDGGLSTGTGGGAFPSGTAINP